MSEDIIARLTQNAEDFCSCPLCIKTINTMHDAAKEIENLRQQIKQLIETASKEV